MYVQPGDERPLYEFTYAVNPDLALWLALTAVAALPGVRRKLDNPVARRMPGGWAIAAGKLYMFLVVWWR